MLQLVCLHLLAAVAAPSLVRTFGRRAFVGLAAVPGAAFVWALTQTPAMLAGPPYPSQSVSWVPSIGLSLDTRLDSLSWLMVVVVGGIGWLMGRI